MNVADKSGRWALAQFGIGQPVPRSEDPKLVQGQGRYTDDIDLPDQVYAAIVRSTHAHGIIRSVDTAAARAMRGVVGIYLAADLERYGPLKCGVPFKNRDGTDMKKPRRPALASGKVRFAGDPIACVVAETLSQAKDAAEAVATEIDPLPAVTLASEAVRAGAPLLYDDVPNNVSLDYHYGDSEKVAAAFAQAAHVTKLDLRNSRMVALPIEPRSAIGVHDSAQDRFTLHLGCQGVFGVKMQLADVLGVPPDKVRVLTGNVGGSFGMKIGVYPEYVCVLHAARQLGRPVKWTDERSGSFLSDHHGRDHEVTGELALDEKGRFLAVRITGFGNMGAFLGTVSPVPATLNIVKNASSLYRTPLIEVGMKCVFTNTPFVSAYRGAGRPEGNYYMERLIDAAAADMGIDRIAMRRKNQIPPSSMPYAACSGMTYDSGDFPALLKQALETADVGGFARRKRDSRKQRKLRGFGLACYLEVTAPPNKEMGGIRFEANGDVTILTGTLDYGQGHATSFAQVLTAQLGVPFERIRLIQGDSDELTTGGGTGGSRSITSSGAAIVGASAKVIEQGKAIASHVLEAASADIEFTGGRFVIAGTDRSIDIMELAETLRNGLALPPDVPHSLDVSHESKGMPSAFPNGVHVAEVEIDPETGAVAVVRYSSVNDFGTIINPMLVEGQIHGGVAQGLSQALFEEAVFDESGQLLTGSLMDYTIPRALQVPQIECISHPVPAKSNPLGTKGCGEAGCAGGLSSVVNAVMDALSEYGIRHIDMPVTPERIWRIIREARPSQSMIPKSGNRFRKRSCANR